MHLSDQVKPISYLKSNAAEIPHRLAEDEGVLVITQNGEAKTVLQDIRSYEQTQETMTLLKILALGEKQIEEGRVKETSVAFGDLIRRKRAS